MQRHSSPSTTNAAIATLLAGLCALSTALPARAALAESSLRFYGHGGSPGDNFVFPDRVRVLIEPHVPADIGATDFTIEFWMKGSAAENPNPPLGCGFGIDWVNGNILIDRDRYNQGRKFGIALLGGTIAWGVSSDFENYTLCGAIDVLDEEWHHVAVGRRASDGRMWIFVDGALDATGPASGGPAGNVSYPDGAIPGNFCSADGGSGGSQCGSDRYLVFGAEKHGFDGINYSGWLDEIRLSSTLRYTAPFTPPAAPFAPDAGTAALYHMNEGAGTAVSDASGAAGGPSSGVITFGGSPPAGPVWSSDSPFSDPTGVGAPGDRAPLDSDASWMASDADADGAAAIGGVRLVSLAPNPFRSRVALRFEIERAQPLAVRVHDASGRAVATLWRGEVSAGAHSLEWDGTDGSSGVGRAMPAGVYFVRWSAGPHAHTERVALIR